MLSGVRIQGRGIGPCPLTKPISHIVMGVGRWNIEHEISPLWNSKYTPLPLHGPMICDIRSYYTNSERAVQLTDPLNHSMGHHDKTFTTKRSPTKRSLKNGSRQMVNGEGLGLRVRLSLWLEIIGSGLWLRLGLYRVSELFVVNHIS